jgi:hypothetical protein
MGVNKMVSVGCSPLSETDAANGTVLTKRQHPAAQAATQQATQQEFPNSSRRNVAPLAGCPLFRVFCVRI